MKLTCDAKRLALACNMACATTKGRTTLPITKFALIQATKEGAWLKATNLEYYVSFDLKAEVIEEGEGFVNPRRALSFASREGGRVSIETINDGETELRSLNGEGSIKMRLHVPAPKDKVPLPDMKADLPIIVLPKSFSQRCGYALQCVAEEESRPVLTGVCLDFGDNTFSMASADGFRLIVVKEDFDSPEPYRFIIPAEPLRLLKYMTGEISLSYDSGKAQFSLSSGDMTILSQTIQGTYPQYLQLIPEHDPLWTIQCSAPIMHQRLRQMLHNEGSGILRMNRPLPKEDEGWLILSTRCEEIEDTEAKVPAKQEGDGKIAVQCKYLLTAMSIFSEVRIEVTSPSSPIKITGDLDGVTVVIMPMFVQW